MDNSFQASGTDHGRETSMIQSAERIFVMGHESPIGSALVRQLIHVGHPHNQILVRSPSEPMWTDQESVCEYLAAQQLDMVYLIDSACSEADDRTHPAHAKSGERFLPPSAMIKAAFNAGVGRLMHVATAATEPAALQRDDVLNASDLDYRRVLTCEPYGPYWPGRAPLKMPPAARLIERLLHQFSTALVCGADPVTIKANPGDRLELMFVNDIAEAIVQVMDAPRCVLNAHAPTPTVHIEIGADNDVEVVDLVRAVAAAAGFRGGWKFEATHPSQAGRRLDNSVLAGLGWRPLIQLDTGLELTAMDFRLRHMTRHMSTKDAHRHSASSAASASN